MKFQMKRLSKCPICEQYHDHIVKTFHQDVDSPLLELLMEEAPNWKPSQGACTRCLDQANVELQLSLFKGMGDPTEVNGYKILPVPLRLRSVPNLTGKGVTICIIDSSFYPHPDLIFPINRILKIIDITQSNRTENYFSQPRENAWHGTMTSVVCAGNGHLSNGLYTGLASQANLVLLKVMDESGAITGENITLALKWAIKNRARYNIKIINLSVSDDDSNSYKINVVDQAVKEAVEAGITIVVAAGNNPLAELKAPANSPHAITVGGLDDRNTLDPFLNTLYHSTFGETSDGFQKPDLIAPAIWLAAPILPGTDAQREAAALFDLHDSSDIELKTKLVDLIDQTSLSSHLLFEENDHIRFIVNKRITEAKYISPHYQHADGTSFAAPIICGVIAQMLEVNLALDPITIRDILLVTARKIFDEPVEQQGWGVIHPEHAVQMAGGQPLSIMPLVTPIIDSRHKMIDFYFQHSNAKEVILTGDFVDWSKDGIQLKFDEKKGLWKKSISFPGVGVFRYKFLIDKKQWMSDPRNLYRENDGFNGFNSKVIIP